MKKENKNRYAPRRNRVNGSGPGRGGQQGRYVEHSDGVLTRRASTMKPSKAIEAPRIDIPTKVPL